MSVNARILAAGIEYIRQGYDVVPLREGTKKLEFPSPRPFLESELRHWFRRRLFNLGILMREGVMVIDFDSEDMIPKLAQMGFLKNPRPPPMVRTRKGVHVYAQHDLRDQTTRLRFKGLPIDLKFSGHVVASPSLVEGHTYEWISPLVPKELLPLFNGEVLKEEPKRPLLPVGPSDGTGDVMVRRARGFISRIEGTITGQGGCHNRCFRVAAVLVQKFGLSFEQAWPIFKEWNEQCEPPWTDKELEHKLLDALKKKGA